MAIGRPSRSSKRTSSSSSYTSTITTISFIALCVLGVWMLSPSSIIPPSTNKASSLVSTSDTNQHSIFQDNPAADTIKFEESIHQVDDKAAAAATADVADEKDKHTQISEESAMTTAQSVNQLVIPEETPPVIKEVEEKLIPEPQKPQPAAEVQEEKPANPDDTQKPQSAAEVQEERPANPDDTQNIGGSGDNVVVVANNQGDADSKPAEEVKSLDEQQRQQLRMEDAGIQNPAEEKPENKVTEEDQAQRMHQQQQQMQDAQKVEIKQQEVKSDNNETEEKQIFRDVTTPGVQVHQLENQDPRHPVQKKPSDPSGASSEIPKESKDSKKSWSTQASESENQKERRKDGDDSRDTWQLCNVTTGTDYIPCLDNEKAIKKLSYTGHFEHRERHCPEEPPTCLVPVPEGYKTPIPWPSSRDKIWYHNVPHTKLAEFKGHQNWVKVTGEFLTFPGGGTQFINGALHYIDFLQKVI
ncbi:Probable methyltransferase PMT27 [Linum perenne]